MKPPAYGLQSGNLPGRQCKPVTALGEPFINFWKLARPWEVFIKLLLSNYWGDSYNNHKKPKSKSYKQAINWFWQMLLFVKQSNSPFQLFNTQKIPFFAWTSNGAILPGGSIATTLPFVIKTYMASKNPKTTPAIHSDCSNETPAFCHINTSYVSHCHRTTYG